MTEKRINCDDGVERSFEEALKWYREIAEDNTFAPFFGTGGPICRCRRGGLHFISEADDECRECDDRCSIGTWDGVITDVMRQTSGSTAHGMAHRGYAYATGGSGVEKDMAKAIEWYQKAAEA